jgi:hypothetical protein
MNNISIEFLTKLKALLEEYEANIEADKDSWDALSMTISVFKPEYLWIEFDRCINVKNIDKCITKEMNT